jgi:hypothetical protein
VVELSSGRRRLLARCELVVLQGGYMQAMELNHTFPQVSDPHAITSNHSRTNLKTRIWFPLNTLKKRRDFWRI